MNKNEKASKDGPTDDADFDCDMSDEEEKFEIPKAPKTKPIDKMPGLNTG